MDRKPIFSKGHRAFTLIEVLVSIALLSLVLLALYQSLSMLRNSNIQLFNYMQKASEDNRGMQTLFLDIAGSDGNLTLEKDEFARLCIENTINSLYALPSAKVCWVVSKEEHALLRSEGNRYSLPLRSGEKVSVDKIMTDLELFDIYRTKTDVLVLLKQKEHEAIAFMVQGVSEPRKKAKPVRGRPPPNAQPGGVPPREG